MKPLKFEESDRILGAGDNPNTGELHVVTALDPELPKGYGVIVSCWEPSAEELAEIIKSKRVYIGVLCALDKPTQSPIYALGINPFEKLGWKQIQYRQGSQRMFEGRVDISDLYFLIDERRFCMTVSAGEHTFILEEVVEIKDGSDPESFGTKTKEYYKAWEILSGKYKEI